MHAKNPCSDCGMLWGLILISLTHCVYVLHTIRTKISSKTMFSIVLEFVKNNTITFVINSANCVTFTQYYPHKGQKVTKNYAQH